MKRLLNLTATIALTAALSACTTGGSAPAQTVQTIELSPASAAVTIGQTAALSATARDAAGAVVPGVTFTWKSSSDATATVAAGVVTGQAAGSAQITASAAGVTSNAATVTVTAPAPAASYSLSVSGDKLPVITGTSASLTVNVTRTGDFTGAVSVNLSGLPTGASSAAVTIPEGQTSATVTVSAAPTAPHSQPTAVTLTGSASGTPNVTKTVTVTVRGPAGSLDTTFGAGGIVTTPFGAGEDYLGAVAVQPDGKVLVAGSTATNTSGNDFAVARYTRDGTLDPSFGTGGKVQIDFSGQSDTARAIAIQPDGKIVIAGGATNAGGEERFGLARLNANGSLDSGFGTGGKVITVFTGSSGDRAQAVLVQPDGRVVVGGQASFGSAATGVDFAVARYTASGVLDSTFGAGGQTTTAIKANSGSDTIRALALQMDKIVAVGGDGDFLAARYTAAGTLDASFGAGGKVGSVFGSSIGQASAVALDSQNRLILAGQRDNDTAAVRLTENGALDPTFGSGGKAVVALSTNWDAAEGLAVQSDGKVVLVGWKMPDAGGSATDFAVTRLTASGGVDTAFGTGGTTLTPVAPGIKTDQAHAVALQPDDRIPATRIIAAGERNDSNNDFALTRLWP